MWVWFHRWFNDILIIYMKKVWKTIVTENQRRSSKAPVTLHRIKLYQLPFKKENQTIIPSAKMYTKIANPSLDQQFSKNNVLKIYFRKGNNWKKLENELRSCLKRSHSEKKTEIVVIKSNRRDPAITKSYDSKKHASEAHQKSWQQKKTFCNLNLKPVWFNPLTSHLIPKIPWQMVRCLVRCGSPRDMMITSFGRPESCMVGPLKSW